MFKKSDTLALLLAFITTVLIVTLGFSWLANSNLSGFSLFAQDSDSDRTDNDSFLSDAQKTKAQDPDSKQILSLSAAGNSQNNFTVPVIVPQGTSVTINGSEKLNQINQALGRSFHQQYPGTIITTDADGSNYGLNLLYSRAIDLAALDRPLSQVEKEAGLRQVAIHQQSQDNGADSQMYYIYQEPLSPDTETFLGFLLSEKGQQTVDKF